MNADKMIFEELVQNDEFIQNISNPRKSDEYIAALIRKYPERKETILLSAEFIRYNSSRKITTTPQQSDRLYNSVVRKLYSNKHTKKPGIVRLTKLYRVAAVAIILLSVGYWGYLKYNQNVFEDFAQMQTTEITEGNSKLILSDGTQYMLEDEGAEITYQKNGERIVINTEKGDKVIKNKSSKTSMNQVIVPYGKRQELLLSDGTLVTLNSGSKLIFPAEFLGSTRKVFLEGEAFFNVQKRIDKMPFLVETNNIEIKVLGTEFNVSAYANENEVSAVLVEGSVEVSQKNKLLNNPEFVLTPGQGCFYDVEEETAHITEVEMDNYISWLNGYLKFQDQTLYNVVQKLRRHYNKSIVLEDEQLSNVLMSGKLILSEDIESVITNLSMLLKTRTTINDENGVIIIKSK